ncbi:hypothetical protein F2Q68_00015834 [Brassica cretica]|uniref:Uncharacterized protein n=2 Tax=Brassica cretica TaxID=69181 RepID=A0A8S9HQU2_BRACR|nr:hypothetical protein F2Q68_00015834 [Brassica cretica]
MQRSDGCSDTDASTSANGAESATEKYILGSKLEEIHLGEGRSHDGSFLKDFGEMQRSDGCSDTDASTSANGAESATEKYILGSKLEEIHLGEGRSHDGSFLKDFGEVLGNLT